MAGDPAIRYTAGMRTPHPYTHPKLQQVRKFAHLLDSAFAVPGTKIRVGLDPVLGVVPGLGDGLSTLMSCYMIYLAHQWEMPRHVIYRMFGNILIDLLLGLVPVLGDIFDVFWKSNLRNLELLEDAWHRYKPPSYPEATHDADLPVIDVEAHAISADLSRYGGSKTKRKP